MSSFIFFFQAEDGIRDRDVTGVQTCALPISQRPAAARAGQPSGGRGSRSAARDPSQAARLGSDLAARVESRPLMIKRLIDRKSTRLNSSHITISYAVFCLKKKKRDPPPSRPP